MIPAFEPFREIYESGQPQVVWTSLTADLETPVSAYLKLVRPGETACLLESITGGNVRNRYSFIGLAPDLIWRTNDGRAEIARGVGNESAFQPATGDPLETLSAIVDESRIELPPHLPPMAAGLIGYLGYDMVRLMEKLPAAKPDPLGTPDALFMRPTIMVVFDIVKEELTLVTPVRPADGQGEGQDAEAAYAEARQRLEDISQRLRAPLPAALPGEALATPEVTSNTGRDDYIAMVGRAREHIAAGDIFQVVLSQRFSRPFALPAFSLYRALRRSNPSPFMYFLDFSGFQIVGASPEILVRLRDGEVTVRPIAGTRPRGADEAEDAALEKELLADPKERAEHLMLLDLGRNDVGRVAEPGSVRVTERDFVERYSHVMHIVSNVTGRLRQGLGALEALKAGFPAGTVSGAPKIRAMEIIDALEKEKRGIYAGAVGYFASGGTMDTCIILRTAVVKDGVMHVQAGAGIVWDSDPAAEHEECRHKAMALFAAAEAAELGDKT